MQKSKRRAESGMAYKDVLIQLSSYPERTPTPPIEQAILFAKTFGARASALAFEIEIPKVGNVLANALLDLPGMVAAERQKSAANAHALIAEFESIAARHGVVSHESVIEHCSTSHLAAIATEHARVRDLTMIPIGKEAALQHYVAECIVFGSGRPAIVLPEEPKLQRPSSFDVVGVAWDFSRPAARAVADAMPILQRAKSVRVVTITQEKPIDTKRSGTELAKHLACHGIEPILEQEQAAGRTIGSALADYAAAHSLDLLVMGAYGHSRMRDFILGGATKSIIADPPLPVLLSH
jgi:nucleotide-binding universal stress UspA family protein